MAMTIVHVNGLLEDATREHRLDALGSADLLLPMGAGAVDPELIKPHADTADIEDAIEARCSSL